MRGQFESDLMEWFWGMAKIIGILVAVGLVSWVLLHFLPPLIVFALGLFLVFFEGIMSQPKGERRYAVLGVLFVIFLAWAAYQIFNLIH